MKLLLGQVHGKGTARHEVLTLGVIEDCTLAMYIVGSFVATGTKVGQRLQDSIWLPKWQVAGGDTVHVHTGKGRNHREPSEDRRRIVHHIYMNRSRPIWGSKRRRAVLLAISTAGMLDPNVEAAAMAGLWDKLS